MNNSKNNKRSEVTLEERYTNVSELLANMSERYDALSSAFEKERLLRSEMVNEQAASELAALRKLHEEEVARIKAEARAEILRELSQREAEIDKRSAALDQREKELYVRREKAKFTPEERSTLYDSLCANNLLIPKSIDYVRREFERAKTENVFLSNFGLASFQIIYGVEELIKELGLTGADKIAYRKENAAIAWQSLLAWCVFTVNDVPKNSQMHKACNYVIRHYDELTAYMDYDVVPLDNNATESAIRALVMGKQNYLFCQNEESCHYAAVMYTFFAACKVLKINPEKWLSDVLDKIPFTPKEKLSELLPQNWIKSNPQAIV